MTSPGVPPTGSRLFTNIAAKPINIRAAARRKAEATGARIEPRAVFVTKAGEPTLAKVKGRAFVLTWYELEDGSGWVLATHPKSGASLVEEVTAGGAHAASQSLPAASAFVVKNFQRAPVYTPMSKKSTKKGPAQGGAVDIVSEPPIDILPGRTRIGAATKRTLQPGGFEKSALVDPSRSIKTVVRDRDLEARSAFLVENEAQQKRVFGSARIEYESTAVGAAVRNRNMVGGERFRKADFFVATVQVRFCFQPGCQSCVSFAFESVCLAVSSGYLRMVARPWLARNCATRSHRPLFLQYIPRAVLCAARRRPTHHRLPRS